MEWELLTVISQSVQIRRSSDTFWQRHMTTEHFSRVRVIVSGRLGVSLTSGGTIPLNDQVDMAIQDAVRGPAASWSSRESEPVPPPPVRPKPVRGVLGHAALLAVERRRVKFRLRNAPGSELKEEASWTIYTFGVRDGGNGIPVARLDAGSLSENPLAMLRFARTSEARKQDLSGPWLFSPLALSQLAVREFAAALNSDGSLPWERLGGVWVTDPHWLFRRDFEGTVRHPVTFVRAGELITTAYDRQRAMGKGVSSTGHGGVASLFLPNVLVGPDPSLPPRDPVVTAGSACVIVSLHVFPGNALAERPVCLTVLQAAGGTEYRTYQILAVCDPLGVFAHGRWCGPVQHGIEPWSSPWVELASPGDCFRIVNTV